MSQTRRAALILSLALVAQGCAKTKSTTEARSAFVTDKALVDGHLVRVTHSRWDGGRSADLFDTDPNTLARTENANPAVLEFELPTPRPLHGISVTMGGANFKLDALARPTAGPAHAYSKEFRGLGADPTLTLDFDTGGTPIASLRVEVLDLDGGDGHIHIRTVKLR